MSILNHNSLRLCENGLPSFSGLLFSHAEREKPLVFQQTLLFPKPPLPLVKPEAESFDRPRSPFSRIAR